MLSFFAHQCLDLSTNGNPDRTSYAYDRARDRQTHSIPWIILPQEQPKEHLFFCGTFALPRSLHGAPALNVLEADLLGAAAHAALRLVVAESVLHGVFEGLNVRHIFFFLLNVRPG